MCILKFAKYDSPVHKYKMLDGWDLSGCYLKICTQVNFGSSDQTQKN
jgi:hypothetical protein